MREHKSFFFGIFLSLFALCCSNTEKKDALKDENLIAQEKRIAQLAKKDEFLKLEIDDMELRRSFSNEVLEAIEKEDFEKLETMAHQINIQKERFPGGDWKISRFYQVIYPPAGQGKDVDWLKRLSKLQSWKEKYPDSIYANLAVAYCQIGYGWNIRGGGFANEVTTEQFALFEKMLLKAEKTLEGVSKKRNVCMAWYRGMQFLGTGLGWSKSKMNELVESGFAVEPLYYDLYEGHAMYLLPRWHGEEGEWVIFAEELANRVGGNEGDIIYAEICWRTSRVYDVVKFFDQHKLKWSRIKKGFQAREEKYGPSYRYMNAYCLLAGGWGDKITTRILMKKLGDRWEPDFWHEKKYFDEYKRWAFAIK
jgi:hypothetical protein